MTSPALRTPRILDEARAAGRLTWQLLDRVLATEGRYQVMAPYLREALAHENLAFLPEATSAAFRERNQSVTVQKTGDPLSVYWADLRRLRPTNRREEFLLARCIDLLRGTLLELLGAEPAAEAVAIAEERSSPYSPVLAALKERPRMQRTTTEEYRRRLYQRLDELHAIQSTLVARNLHLVPTQARNYRHLGVAWQDLIQEGNAALLRAVERYDRTTGVRFASYAGWWIQQGILKALSFQSRTVRLPVYLAQALHRVRGAEESSPETLTVEQIAKRTGLPEDRVERAQEADRYCLSINRSSQNSDGDGEELKDWIPDTRETPMPDEPSRGELRAQLEELLERLPAREALVLRLRFGLAGGKPWTLDQVRAKLSVSRERVRQLQAQALRRLGQPNARKRLTRFVG